MPALDGLAIDVSDHDSRDCFYSMSAGSHFKSPNVLPDYEPFAWSAITAVASENSDSCVSIVEPTKDRMRNNISEPRDRTSVGRVLPRET